MNRQLTDVVVFRPAETPSEEYRRSPAGIAAIEGYRNAFKIPLTVDLAGSWWGVFDRLEGRVHCCESKDEAISLGLGIAERQQVDLWLEEHGHHPDAELIRSFRTSDDEL